MMTRILLITVCTLSFVGCKVDSKAGSSSAKAFYSYDFTENGCPTGAHSSNSKTGICKALEDHTLNNHCAYNLRAEMFQKYDCMTLLAGNPNIVSSVASNGNGGPAEQSGATVTAGESSPATKRSFAYELTENNCSTGKHTFSRRKDLCDGLFDDRLNNFCAAKVRARMFAANRCPDGQ